MKKKKLIATVLCIHAGRTAGRLRQQHGIQLKAPLAAVKPPPAQGETTRTTWTMPIL